MKCRILYLVGQLGPGGLERQLYLLLRTLDRERYRPEVVVWKFREADTYVSHLRNLGIPLHGFSKPMSAPAKLIALRRLIVRKQPEIIHSQSFYTNVAAWWGTLGTKSVAVGAMRSNFTEDKKTNGFLLGGLNARLPETQIYNNFAAAKEARRRKGPFAPRKIFIIHNGLDLREFRKLPLPANGKIRILGMGSLVPYKRWDRLLAAASRLKERGVDFVVEIAGAGPMRDSLRHDARDLDVSDRIRLLGHIDDVRCALERCTFLAHTSDVEGCPNVIMEAMACGRAVVATDAGDSPALVDDGKTGFTVARGDEVALADRIATLVAHPELCRRMGEAGGEKAVREFGLNRLVEETIAVYGAAGWRSA